MCVYSAAAEPEEEPMAGAVRQMLPPVNDDWPWGDAIQYYLRDRRVSQAEICRITKLTSNTVSNAARGRHTNTQTLTKIARALGVSLEDLMSDPRRRPPLN